MKILPRHLRNRRAKHYAYASRIVRKSFREKKRITDELAHERKRSEKTKPNRWCFSHYCRTVSPLFGIFSVLLLRFFLDFAGKRTGRDWGIYLDAFSWAALKLYVDFTGFSRPRPYARYSEFVHAAMHSPVFIIRCASNE